jgi:hypothetical protein
MRLTLCRHTGRIFWAPGYCADRFTEPRFVALSEHYPDPAACVKPWCQDEPRHRGWCCAFHAWRGMPDARRQEQERTAILRTLLSHGVVF